MEGRMMQIYGSGVVVVIVVLMLPAECMHQR